MQLLVSEAWPIFIGGLLTRLPYGKLAMPPKFAIQYFHGLAWPINFGRSFGRSKIGATPCSDSPRNPVRANANASNEGIERGTAEYARRQAEQDRRDARGRTSGPVSNGAASGGGRSGSCGINPAPPPAAQPAAVASTREMYG